MDYKEIVNQIELMLNKDIEQFKKEIEEYEARGIESSFFRGRLSESESMLIYLKDIKEIYA